VLARIAGGGWRRRLLLTTLQALRDFFNAQNGSTEPLYFTIRTTRIRSFRRIRPVS